MTGPDLTWPIGRRRRHRRYERKAEHFLAFMSTACTPLCCLRSLRCLTR